MLFLFCLFLCCFITRLTCKCEARCCYKPESHFSTILFANNLARSSSVIQLGCFVAWPDGKGTGHYLSTLFSVSVCVQTQSVRWDGAFRNKAYSSWQHGSCNWRHGGRRNLPKGLFLTGGGAFCSDVLGTWPRSGQFQFFFFFMPKLTRSASGWILLQNFSICMAVLCTILTLKFNSRVWEFLPIVS